MSDDRTTKRVHEKTIFLHVGLEKTGTTAIQHMLNVERAALAELYDIFVAPRKEYSVFLHHRFAKSFISPKVAAQHLPMSDEELNGVLAAFDSSGRQRFVISSELFSYANQNQMMQIRSFFEGRHVKIVIFCRSQDQYFTSQYLQSLKGVWRLGKVPAELDEFRTHNMDYNEFALMWERAFGLENVIVALYGDKAFPTLFDHFLHIVSEGLHNVGAITYPETTINPGLSAVHQAIISEDLKLLDDRPTQVAIEALALAHSDKYSRRLDHTLRHGLLSQGQRERLLAGCAASNTALARRHFGRDTLFIEESVKNETRDVNLDDFRKIYVELVGEALRAKAPALPKSPVPVSCPVLYIGGTGRSGTTTLITALSRLPGFENYGGIELKFFTAPGGLVSLMNELVHTYNFGRATRAVRDFGSLWSNVCGGSPFNQVGLEHYIPRAELKAMLDEFVGGLTQNGVPIPCAPSDFLAGCTRLLNRLIVKVASEKTVYFMEKSPHNLLDLPLLEGISPRAKYIHILRDPLLTALSISRQSWGPTEPDQVIAYVFGYLKRWEKVKEEMTRGHGIKILELTLEDILLDRDRTAQEMADYLGCDIAGGLSPGLAKFSAERQWEDMKRLEKERRDLYEISPTLIRKLADEAEEKLKMARAR